MKLCHRLHVNPREAQICSECGSRDLTQPAPKLSFWLRFILFLLSFIPGILLLILSAAFLIAYAYVLFVQPALQFRFMLGGLVLGLLWLLYMELPGFVRSKVHRQMRKASK